MLTYRTASTIFIILAGLVILMMLFRPSAGWALLPLSAGYIALLAIGSARICSRFYLRAFCKNDTSEKKVLLTFDDGPDDKITPEVLEILDKHQVKAAFFLIGRKAEANPDLVGRIAGKGHTIGLHSYSHAFWFDLYSAKKMERDLLKSEEVIRKITGEKPDWFRPPYGVTNPMLAKAVKKLGYRVIGWSVRSFDTSCRDENRVAERVIKGLHPGAVILLHDTREITPGVVDQVIRRAVANGYTFADADKLNVMG